VAVEHPDPVIVEDHDRSGLQFVGDGREVEEEQQPHAGRSSGSSRSWTASAA
jgi:hypothetical protein